MSTSQPVTQIHEALVTSVGIRARRASTRNELTAPIRCKPLPEPQGKSEADRPDTSTPTHQEHTPTRPEEYAELAAPLAVSEMTVATKHRVIPDLSSIPRPPWIAVAAAVVIIGGVVWWVMFQRLPDIDPRQVIATNLSAAQAALDSGRYIEPPERSAVHYYSTVLALDPTNAEARNGIDRIADRFIENAKTLIIEERFAEAVVALDGVRRVRPDHRRLPLLDVQLRRELERHLSLRAHESMMVSDPWPLRGETTAAMPESPKEKSKEMQKPQEARATPANKPPALPIQDNSRDLHAQVASAAGRATDRDQSDVGNKTVGEANGPDLEQIAGLEQTASVDAAEGAQLATLTASIAPPVAALPAAPVRPKLIKLVEPHYPKEARLRGIQGWVDVSLTVNAAGDVIEPRIEDSSMTQLFGRAALAAVRQWKYEPRASADPGLTQRMRVHVEFHLEDR